MEQQEQPSLLNHALKWGFICGAVTIVFTVLLYVIDYSLMVQIKFALIGLVIGLGLVSYAGIEYRKAVGGFLPFGKAWQVSFITFAVSGLIYVLFNMLLYFVIDPELPSKLVDAAVENQRAMMENFGAPADQIDGELEKARGRTENQFKFGGMLMGYGISLIIYTVLSLITGLIARKNPPMDQM
jgi:hypothetical protein